MLEGRRGPDIKPNYGPHSTLHFLHRQQTTPPNLTMEPALGCTGSEPSQKQGCQHAQPGQLQYLDTSSRKHLVNLDKMTFLQGVLIY